MNNLRRNIACVGTLFAGLIISSAAVAGGNGSGNEPPQSEKESAVTVCSLVPWFCTITTTSGNGSGNEPPSTK
ncbi:hypothetical protein MTsDn5_08200 [Alteromonas gracilis]